ncbi:MAG: hypothetical protein AUK46_03660 [Flavobacteriaceae bacterium CG2_30_31_66]|nr:MAG: hypothetical protein AUK46_03660 [Flavobacteriaceae bacterium CG2_30_31_66]
MILNIVVGTDYKSALSGIVGNFSKTTTLIGKWEGYLENIWNTQLVKQGYNKGGFNILGEISGSLLEKWQKNKQWLNDAISRGDVIRITADPTKVENLIFNNLTNINFKSFNDVILYMKSFSETSQQFNNLSFFGKEIYTLINKNFIYDPVLKIFKP